MSGVKGFNAEQQAVIRAEGGYHLVLAPPGCGKTAVLAERIAWAHSRGVDFGQMACLTFTNRAARGMRERITDRLPQAEGLERLFVGNVHRFCSHFLFEHRLVSEHTTVIDTDTSISILADYLGDDELAVLAEARHRQRYSQVINLQHLLYQCEHHHPGDLMVHRDALPAASLRELCTAFGLPYTQKSTIRLYEAADVFVDDPAPLSPAAQSLMLSLFAARKYEQYKRENSLIDFEDLLLLTYEALQQHPGIAPFSWLQVDEVQDLNPLQLAIIDLFTAPGATVVYLGDAQQAIFSFMGAKTDTLALLRQRCGDGHFYNFFHNYRSPDYLLRIFNTYASQQLEIDPALLPSTDRHEQRQEGDVVLAEAPDNSHETAMAARLVRTLYDRHPDESIAVVVAFNSDADEVSNALADIPHFKISGVDFFTTAPMRLLLAHLGVLATDHNFIAWAQLLVGLQVYSTNSSARQMVRSMMQLGMTPADALTFDNSTYTQEFCQAYDAGDIVVFDTETTGLDVFHDDVVQIAAVRTRHGQVTDELNLFIETSRPIPAMLGDVANPLATEYERHEHLAPAEALRRFCRFAQGAALLGHNATFDVQIMEHNMRRYAPGLSLLSQWPTYWDTLRLAHLLHPSRTSYKLRDLIADLSLEGQNSHLANDDILATLSLMVHCYDLARSLRGRQLEFISRHRQRLALFARLYADLYHSARARLYQLPADEPHGAEAEPHGRQDEPHDNAAEPHDNAAEPHGAAEHPALSAELLRAYHHLQQLNRMPRLQKLDYVVNYIDHELLAPGHDPSLAGQLGRHYTDLTTLKESDLCSASSVGERVFVSTVHKAKGLEFDNVIVYCAVEGRFPSAYAKTADDAREEARKFYVAISRARRRLAVTHSHVSVNRWGRQFQNRLTRFLAPVIHLFDQYAE